MDTENQYESRTASQPARKNFTDLQSNESVLLGSALVSYICESHSLRALIIKGPGATALGVRPPRPSSDIDVLVHPKDFQQLHSALTRYGWRARPFAANLGIPNHSATLYNDDWPVDIDLHRYYPGFNIPATRAFVLLSKSSTACDFAGVRGSIPNKCAASIIQVLHALRNSRDLHNSGHATEDLMWLGQDPTRCSGEELHDLAEGLGATGALEPYFRQFYPEEALTMNFPAPSDEWTRRTELTAPGALRMSAILDASGSNRIKILWSSLFSVGESLNMKDLRLQNASFNVRSMANFQRMLDFLKQFPVAVRQVRRYRSQRDGKHQ